MVNLRSAREISAMRRAGLLVWGAHQLAKSLVRPGITTGEIDAAVEEFFLEREAVPLPCIEVIVCHRRHELCLRRTACKF